MSSTQSHAFFTKYAIDIWRLVFRSEKYSFCCMQIYLGKNSPPPFINVNIYLNLRKLSYRPRKSNAIFCTPPLNNGWGKMLNHREIRSLAKDFIYIFPLYNRGVSEGILLRKNLLFLYSYQIMFDKNVSQSDFLSSVADWWTLFPMGNFMKKLWLYPFNDLQKIPDFFT